jgi:ferredoxin
MKARETYILRKADVPGFFESLGAKMRLIAPQKLFGADAMFGVIQSPGEIVWDYGHDLYPPKRFLLPHFEEMFRYGGPPAGMIKDLLDIEDQAIIGIRSCDVKAIRFQERFYQQPIVDPHYMARSEKTVLFSLVCNRPPKRECFCICCDAGPYLYDGYDVQLTDLGDRFLYEIGSEKGEKATALGEHFLTHASGSDVEKRRRIEQQADSLFETIAYVAKAINFLSTNEAPDEVLEKLGSTCFRCGACTNLCPICTCYTMDDRAAPDGSFVRCRSWDSCQYSGFTREASGHNPRPTFGSRLSRRLYHKMSYPYIVRDGTHGCAGCGRCISACLTDLGVPSVVKRMRRAIYKELHPLGRDGEA